MSPFFSCITVTADDPFYLWLLFSPSSSSSRLFTHPSSTDPSFETPSELVSLPFQLNPSTRSSDSTSAYSHLPPLSQQDAQLPQGFRALPSTDVIDVTKLAPQDLPPPAYENVDERPSSSFSRPSALTARASRPLPVPPLDRLSNSPSVPSVSSATGAVSAEPVNPALHSSPPNCIDPVLSAGRPFSPPGTSQLSAPSLGILHSLDPSTSRDWLGGYSTGISPPSSQSPFNSLPRRMTAESSQQSNSSASFDHHSSWNPNQSFSGSQQGLPAASVSSRSSRPISSCDSISTLSPPPPYSPEASSSRNAGLPSEYSPDARSIDLPHPVLTLSAPRGLPPPAPPTILDPPPARPNSTLRSRAPHEPFLSDAPPPPDSWIAVETLPVEYRLVARLPGFRRDAMCVICVVMSACPLTNRYHYHL